MCGKRLLLTVAVCCLLLLAYSLSASCSRFNQSPPSRPSATLSSLFLSYAGLSFFINPVYEFVRALSPQSLHFLPHLLLDHLRFLRSFGSPSVHFFSFRLLRLSITWLQQYDSQSRPRRAFPVTILLTGQSLLPPPPSSLPSSSISLPFYIAAGPPGAERVLLRPSLPAPIMLVSQMGLPPPLPRKPHRSLLSALPRPPLVRARITKSRFKTSRVSQYVSLSLTYRCPLGAYVTCSKGDDCHPHHQDLKTLRGCHRFYRE